ncbi:MAG: helix-turn-helix transcriptional regulator [Oscillospiraceae bacterium]
MSYVSDNLTLFSEIAKCIAMQFGENCEVVVHDLTLPYDRTIVAIENGHVTGRKVGDSGTNTGLEILRGTATNEDKFNYINHSKTGRILRSSSKYFRNAEGSVVGSLCINYDVTDLLLAQKSILAAANINDSDDTREVFTSNVDELLELLMQDTVTLLGKPVDLMTKDDKITAIKHLDGKGAFLIKKSVEKVSEFYGISKFTLYNYLGEGKEQGSAAKDFINA